MSPYYLITFYNPKLQTYEMILWYESIAFWVVEEAHPKGLILINSHILTETEYEEIDNECKGDY